MARFSTLDVVVDHCALSCKIFLVNFNIPEQKLVI